MVITVIHKALIHKVMSKTRIAMPIQMDNAKVSRKAGTKVGMKARQMLKAALRAAITRMRLDRITSNRAMAKAMHKNRHNRQIIKICQKLRVIRLCHNRHCLHRHLAQVVTSLTAKIQAVRPILAIQTAAAVGVVKFESMG